MMRFCLFLVILALLALVNAVEYPAPPANFEAAKWTKWELREVAGSRRGNVDVEFTAADGSADNIKLIRLDLLGDSKARGFAHGALLTKEIVQFAGAEMDKFIVKSVLNLHFNKVDTLPEPLQKILGEMKKLGAAAAPKLFRKAMYWVWTTQYDFTPQYLKDEIDGIAQGMCSTLGSNCDVAAWTKELQTVNMMPELIRMACTAFGAWGKATATGNSLIQLRALDFGSGPWASNTIVSVHRNDPSNPDHAFVSICFPGFVGAITGVAQNGIGISEKVWMTYDKRDLQPGTFKGEADVFVLRDILQKAKSKADAEAIVQAAKRTWAIWIGVGDFATKQFDLIGYKEGSAVTYTDKTIGQMTGQPYLESIAYVDKHPQPSGDGPNGTLPTALSDFYGKISLESTKQIIQHHQTGDVHWAAYDFVGDSMELAIGRTNSEGNYGPDGSSDMSQWCAYNRPTIQWSLSDMWAGRA